MKIHSLNWGEVADARPSWAGVFGRLWAIWPSPVDHDVCFDAAGFHDMDDSDSAWDDDFSVFLERMLAALAVLGTSSLMAGEYPRHGRHACATLRDALTAAATVDNFPPCVVSFGHPAVAWIRTSDGHPIVWLWTIEWAEIETVMPTIASELPIHEVKLQWEKLW